LLVEIGHREAGPTAHEARLLASLFNAAQQVSPNNRNPMWQGWLEPPPEGRALYGPVSLFLFFAHCLILNFFHNPRMNV
jgi:hypothetical protein